MVLGGGEFETAIDLLDRQASALPERVGRAQGIGVVAFIRPHSAGSLPPVAEMKGDAVFRLTRLIQIGAPSFRPAKAELDVIAVVQLFAPGQCRTNQGCVVPGNFGKGLGNSWSQPLLA